MLSSVGSSVPSRDPGRRALRKLLDRIRNQRDREQPAAVEETSSEDVVVTDVSSIETGSLNSQEREQAGSIEEQTSSVTESEEGTAVSTLPVSLSSISVLEMLVNYLSFSGPEVSDEPIVAGTIPLPEEEAHVTPVSEESERRTQQTDVSIQVTQGLRYSFSLFFILMDIAMGGALSV